MQGSLAVKLAGWSRCAWAPQEGVTVESHVQQAGVTRSLISEAAIVGVATLLALAVFLWKRVGIGSGRKLETRVAAHLGIPRNLFHSLVEHGVVGSSRDLLATLEKSRLSLHQASVELAPSLARGAQRLEAHFGPQEQLDHAKPVIARLLAEYEKARPA
jgi:hypothetical protein